MENFEKFLHYFKGYLSEERGLAVIDGVSKLDAMRDIHTLTDHFSRN